MDKDVVCDGMGVYGDIVDEILSGKIFVYPTDTIYGLGCNALNGCSVNKIKDMKRRDRDKPISVIAPSFEWIKDNCVVGNIDLEKYLPGPYTLILKKRDIDFLNECSNGGNIGVRMPNHEFFRVIEKAGVPFVTTSVNLSGESPISNVCEISDDILEGVDIVIDVGEVKGKPSILVIDGKEMVR